MSKRISSSHLLRSYIMCLHTRASWTGSGREIIISSPNIPTSRQTFKNSTSFHHRTNLACQHTQSHWSVPSVLPPDTVELLDTGLILPGSLNPASLIPVFHHGLSISSLYWPERREYEAKPSRTDFGVACLRHSGRSSSTWFKSVQLSSSQ